MYSSWASARVRASPILPKFQRPKAQQTSDETVVHHDRGLVLLAVDCHGALRPLAGEDLAPGRRLLAQPVGLAVVTVQHGGPLVDVARHDTVVLPPAPAAHPTVAEPREGAAAGQEDAQVHLEVGEAPAAKVRVEGVAHAELDGVGLRHGAGLALRPQERAAALLVGRVKGLEVLPVVAAGVDDRRLHGRHVCPPAYVHLRGLARVEPRTPAGAGAALGARPVLLGRLRGPAIVEVEPVDVGVAEPVLRRSDVVLLEPGRERAAVPVVPEVLATADPDAAVARPGLGRPAHVVPLRVAMADPIRGH
mmetsp:Transcript_13138/g.26668  ORF Transcript_13138/g.26668 Transcript_13138/m.26668 type:complete len:306 (+) Transcript_13138:98-1015(+)